MLGGNDHFIFTKTIRERGSLSWGLYSGRPFPAQGCRSSTLCALILRHARQAAFQKVVDAVEWCFIFIVQKCIETILETFRKMFDHRQSELLFTLEIVVKRSFGYAGLLQDCVDASGVESLAGDQIVPIRMIMFRVSFFP